MHDCEYCGSPAQITVEGRSFCSSEHVPLSVLASKAKKGEVQTKETTVGSSAQLFTTAYIPLQVTPACFGEDSLYESYTDIEGDVPDMNLEIFDVGVIGKD